MKYIFIDPDPEKEKTFFSNQLNTLYLLRKQLRKDVIFISKESFQAQNHFICGLLIKDNLFLINPIGISSHGEFYSQLEHIKINKIYISNNVIQKDQKGLVSCGVIITELVRYFASMSSQQILEITELAQQKQRGGLIYYEIDITSALSSELLNLQNNQEYNGYQEAIILLRYKHFNLLKGIQESTLSNLLFSLYHSLCIKNLYWLLSPFSL